MTGSGAHDPAKEAPDTTLAGDWSEAQELSGALASSPDEERLMRSVLENEEQAVEDGHLVTEAINRSVGSFTPDLMFQNLVKDYRNASRLYGETLIRALSGYSPDYVRKNVNIPEFQQALSRRIEENVEALQERGLLDEHGFLTARSEKLAALVLYTEELDALVTKGLGKQARKERSPYGEPDEAVTYKRGKHRFRDLALKRCIKTAVRRGHDRLRKEDLKAYDREERGRIQVVYALDASGSMRGDKLAESKRAGIALAYRAIEAGDEVGLLVFTSKVEKALPPTRDFTDLLKELTVVRAGKETDLARTIRASLELFAREHCTKHLLLLTDAVPTTGKEPRKETLEAASEALSAGVTISIVGISLDSEGESLARDVVELGQGRLYRVKALDELDAIILDDYDALG